MLVGLSEDKVSGWVGQSKQKETRDKSGSAQIRAVFQGQLSLLLIRLPIGRPQLSLLLIRLSIGRPEKNLQLLGCYCLSMGKELGLQKEVLLSFI